jgi:prolipoprotein diacylglyceryl transferase
MAALLAYIPSPHLSGFHIGPLFIHMYGITLLVAILACYWLTSRRWRALGGDSDLVVRVAVWGVAFGVVGARAYHDLTSWSEVPTPKWKGVFEVWEGGLGVWGGILLGTLAGAVVVRRSGNSVRLFMDAIAPGILLAQGIGRIGNWWNQELYGKPTTLPWALKIDPAHRVSQYLNKATFHPTFLYELIWDVIGTFLLIWIGKRFRIKPPGLFALYVVYYCFGRFFEELLRVDPAHHYGPLRLNAWVSIFCFVVALVFFVWWQRRPEDREPRPPRRLRKTPPPPPRPKMAIPRGRVR